MIKRDVAETLAALAAELREWHATEATNITVEDVIAAVENVSKALRSEKST